MTLDPLRAELRQRVRITARRTAIEWEKQVRQGAPVRTGNLQKSVRMRDFQTTSGATIEGKADVDYAEAVSRGTRKHQIRASGRALAFNWPNAPGPVIKKFGGTFVYFKSVSHPGTDPNEFWTRPLRHLPTMIRRIWTEVTQ